MRNGVVFALTVLLGPGCVTAVSDSARIYSPTEALAARLALEGQVIRVRGWLGGCQPQDNRICGLYSNQRNALGPEPLEWALPIDFDAATTSVKVREVVARGRYVVTCRNTSLTICPDIDGYFAIESFED